MWISRLLLALVACALLAGACSSNATGGFDFAADIEGLGSWKANHEKLVEQGGGIDVQAFELGAWFAFTDHCVGKGEPRDDCYDAAAQFIEEQLGSDPSEISQAESLGVGGPLSGAVRAAYDITGNALGKNTQEPTNPETLFADRPDPWS